MNFVIIYSLLKPEIVLSSAFNSPEMYAILTFSACLRSLNDNCVFKTTVYFQFVFIVTFDVKSRDVLKSCTCVNSANIEGPHGVFDYVITWPFF